MSVISYLLVAGKLFVVLDCASNRRLRPWPVSILNFELSLLALVWDLRHFIWPTNHFLKYGVFVNKFVSWNDDRLISFIRCLKVRVRIQIVLLRFSS